MGQHRFAGAQHMILVKRLGLRQGTGDGCPLGRTQTLRDPLERRFTIVFGKRMRDGNHGTGLSHGRG